MKLKYVKRAVMDEPDAPTGLESLKGSMWDDVVKEIVKRTKASILARVERYRRNPPQD